MNVEMRNSVHCPPRILLMPEFGNAFEQRVVFVDQEVDSNCLECGRDTRESIPMRASYIDTPIDDETEPLHRVLRFRLPRDSVVPG